MSNRVIISGPQACGKSHHAERLALHFGCQTVNHEWINGQPVRNGELALTWLPVSEVKRPAMTEVVDFYSAMKAAGLTPNSPYIKAPAPDDGDEA